MHAKFCMCVCVRACVCRRVCAWRRAPQDGDSWLAQVGPLIQQRIERYAASEIRFNLMALVRDKRASLQEAIAQARSALDALGTQQQVRAERERGGTGRGRGVAWGLRGARAALHAAPEWRRRVGT